MRSPGSALPAAASGTVREWAPEPADTGARTVSPLRIVFLIRSLCYGGAERQLVVLAAALRARGHAVSVLTFYPNGELAPELRAADVRVRSLEKRGRWDIATFLTTLRRALREESPNVLHSYLVVPNIVAATIRSAIPGVRVVWGVRASNMDLSHYDWVSRFSSGLARRLCRVPDLHIVNSRAGFEYAVARGYPREKMVVIPNGIDTERFVPDAAAGRRVRDEWQVSATERLVGLVGRLDPVKDHRTFLSAAARVAQVRQDVRFVCVGDGEPRYRGEMHQLANTLGIGERVLWVGSRADMPAVYNALDIACLSSASEGFPNVLAEAMACGVPSVATDVGDSAWLLARPELIAPPGDSETLAARMQTLLRLDADAFRTVAREARERIVTHFSVQSLVSNTEQTLSGVLGRAPA
jgi:glycosyltransferase involved in cell wall biosynthesis